VDGGLILGGEGWKVVDLDDLVADGDEAGSGGREGEVLAGAGDGGAVGVEEEISAVDLVDVDALAGEFGGGHVGGCDGGGEG
jgi:hypothetical protein